MFIITVPEYIRRRRATLARLRRVNAALSRLDEVEAAQAVGIPTEARKPLLGRPALVELRAMLEGVLAELEANWERRN